MGRHSGHPLRARFGQSLGHSALGLLTLRTDDGLEGHAFLGSATYSATLNAQGLIAKLKPLVMGQDPLDRERLYQDMWKRNRHTSSGRLAPWTSPTTSPQKGGRAAV